MQCETFPSTRAEQIFFVYEKVGQIGQLACDNIRVFVGFLTELPSAHLIVALET